MSVEAEMSVLGCMMLDEECARTGADLLGEEMFSHPKTKRVFQAVADQYWKGLPIDGATISSLLPKEDRADVIKLAQYVPTVSHFDAYVRIVRDDWQNKKIQEWLGEYIFLIQGRSTDENLTALHNFLEGQKEIKSIKSAISFTTAAQELSKWLQSGKDACTISCAYRAIDKAMGGFLRKSYSAICSRPGGGKTDFAINLLMRFMKRGYKVLYFSLEMPRLELMQRITSSIAKIDGVRIRDKELQEAEISTVEAIMTSLDKTNKISFIDDPRLSVKEIRHYIHVVKPDAVIIDHIGLIQREETQNAYRELGKISNELKRIAKENDIALINLVQLNRAIDSRKEKEPQLSDIRESGDIEQDADYVMFIQPDEDMTQKNLSGEGWADASLYLRKNRHGKLGAFKFHWQPQYHTYTEVETRY